jgi:hypothetical protein
MQGEMGYTDSLLQVAGIPITLFNLEHHNAARLVPVVLDGENVKTSSNNLRIGAISKDVAQVLQCLDEEENFEIQAFCQSTLEPSAKIHRHQKQIPSERQYSLVLNVNIYGTPSSFEALGAFLTDVDLFLQTPENCDKNVEYRNPHLLTRAGSAPVMTLSLFTKSNEDDGFHEDDGVIDTSNLMALLQNTPNLEETRSPASLITELHRYLRISYPLVTRLLTGISHQKQALTFMLDREQGWCFEGPRKDIWTKSLSDTGSVVYASPRAPINKSHT